MLAALERRPASPREIALGKEDANMPSDMLMDVLGGGFGEVRVKWGGECRHCLLKEDVEFTCPEMTETRSPDLSGSLLILVNDS